MRLEAAAETEAAKILALLEDRLRELAVEAFEAIGGDGMARVDFLLDGEEPYLNEINTIPGFTDISMYPKLWELSGISCPDLVRQLIDLAFERAREEGSIVTSYQD